MFQEMPNGTSKIQGYKKNKKFREHGYVLLSRIKTRAKLKVETRKAEKTICFYVDGYRDHCKTVFEAMGCYYNFCSYQRSRQYSSDKVLKERISKTRIR